MKISFVGADLESLCRNSKQAVRKLGPLSAKKLQTRLAELFSAKNVGELIVGKPHPLTGDRKGDFALSLHAGHRLVFRSVQEPIPVKADGSINWSAVTEIMIIEVGDYHE
ncbi:MAG: killer suppression protein HigA [Pseudomonadota bacterium]|nr:killer suppression protein HigA [Pseudomonadota bacterium]